MPAQPIEVVAGALIDAAGRILIAERPPGRKRAGRWELPGGKREPGESPRDALARELEEELGIGLTRARRLVQCRYTYPGEDRAVHIDAWRVDAWSGRPRALDAQRLEWVGRAELPAIDLLEADRPIVTALVLPEVFVGAQSAAITRARGDGERIGWLVARAGERPAAPDDWVGVIDPDPPVAFSPWSGSVYTAHALATLQPVPDRAGALIRSLDEAITARERGCGFLLVARALQAHDITALAALGLPCYGDAAGAGDAASLLTGRFAWRA